MLSQGVVDPPFRKALSCAFQEGPELCEVDLAHDPKAYPAEQVTHDRSSDRKEKGYAL